MAPAAEKPLRKRMRAEASCDVCARFYNDPVLLDCGGSLCRACAEKLSPPICPDCGAPFDPSSLTANRSLSGLVEVAKQLLEGDSEERPKRAYFCKAEQTILCQTCCDSEEHRDKDMVVAESAAREYKIFMEKCTDKLKKEKDDILSSKAALESETLYFFNQTTEVWEKTRAEFRNVQKFLEAQERELLAQVTKIYREIKINKKELISALSKKQAIIQDIMYDMDEANYLHPSELLENIGDLLKRYEAREEGQPQGSLSPELQSKIQGVADISQFLLGAMQRFRDNVATAVLRHKGITSPDPNSNHPSIVPSEEPPSQSDLDQVQPTSSDILSV